MVLPNLSCTVLEVAEDNDWGLARRMPPRELSPWCDPYIALLVNKLHADLGLIAQNHLEPRRGDIQTDFEFDAEQDDWDRGGRC